MTRRRGYPRPHRSGNEERLPCERPRSRQLTQPLHIALLPVRQRAPWFGTYLAPGITHAPAVANCAVIRGRLDRTVRR